MFEVFYELIAMERIKSSTRAMAQVIDEWEHVFAKDVNLILLKCFMKFIQASGKCSLRHEKNIFNTIKPVLFS